MKPWGKLPGYGRDWPTAWPARTDVAVLPTHVERRAGKPFGRITSVRLPETHPGLERLKADAFAWDGHPSRWSREIGVKCVHRLYWDFRLAGLDDEQAAKQAWAKWQGDE